MLVKVLGKDGGKGRGFCRHIIRKGEVYFIVAKDNEMMAICKNCAPALKMKPKMTITAAKVGQLAVRNSRIFFLRPMPQREDTGDRYA